MNDLQTKQAIEVALKAFASRPLAKAATDLFESLGYTSKKRLAVSPNTATQFLATFGVGKTLNDKLALAGEWRSVDFLFQLTDDEILASGSQQVLFDSKGTYNGAVIESYLFLALELKSSYYTRTALAGITRELNKLFAMPALVLFRHGETLTLAVVNRRLHKRDQTRDVLEKVTLVKDITFADPVRAHLEILNDFALTNLDTAFGVSNFVALHAAWQKRLGSYALSNAFYREIADWYFWAHHQVHDGTIRLPQHCDTEEERSLFLIRLLTRIIFCWFLVEKRLLPAELFRDHPLKKLLKDLSPSAPTYYHAVLQNLFFGTLNMPAEQRGFREKKKDGERYDKNFGITNLWRYEGDFRTPTDWTALTMRVPFLNGGLFDCLDDRSGQKKDNFILDGFSDNPRLACHLPNELFFGPERTVDLSKDYGEEDKRTARSKKAKVRGLVEILSRYKFTIEENTPLEEEIALDPELLGKVFENLLASYNEDTRTTARKALGAFYTPREIVAYMVDQALKSYLGTRVSRVKGVLDDLFSNKATLKDIKPDQRDALIAAIGRVKILDPACGSGAFPMGALHRLVDLLQKLDPNNESWKRNRLAEARQYRELLEQADAPREEVDACNERIADIERSFDTHFHALDFARKLYLIENSIYGVDIQPVAVQIAKLRFFIALVVDQKVNQQEKNLGVRPLPNLETRLVAANTLIPIANVQSDLFSGDIDKLRADLARIRHEHFNARDPGNKRKWRAADAAKRGEISQLLERERALRHDDAALLAAWDPYDQNTSAPFFDSEWMFGIPVGKTRVRGKTSPAILGTVALIDDAGGVSAPVQDDIEGGFDVIISNPPYRKERDSKALFDKVASTSWGAQHKEGKMDLWFYFMHRSIDLACTGGTIVYITSRYWIESAGAQKLIRRLARDVSPIDIVDIGKLTVFDNVAGHHMIHSYRKSHEDLKIDVKRLVGDLSGMTATKSAANVEIHNRNSGQLFALDGRVRLYGSKINLSGGPTLGDRYHVSQGVVQNPDKVNRKNAERFGLEVGAGVFVVSDSELAAISPSSAELRFVKPFYDEADIRRFFARPSSAHLLYLTKKNCPSISSLTNFRKHLEPFRPIMEERRETKNGTIKWFHLHWPRDPSLFEAAHLALPSMFTQPAAACFAGPAYVGIGCNVVVASAADADVAVLACLLNSAVSTFWWRENAKQRGAGYDVGVERLRNFPLPAARVSDVDAASLRKVGSFIGLVGQHVDGENLSQTSRDPLMLAYFEQALNGLVYELYFPEEVHGAGLRLFEIVEQAALPALDAIPERERLAHLRRLFETLYAGAHLLKIALQKLQTLDTVRVIEGKA